MKKRIMVTRYGFAIVEAATDEEAIENVNSMSDGDFDWSKYSSEDAEVVENLKENGEAYNLMEEEK